MEGEKCALTTPLMVRMPEFCMISWYFLSISALSICPRGWDDDAGDQGWLKSGRRRRRLPGRDRLPGDDAGLSAKTQHRVKVSSHPHENGIRSHTILMSLTTFLVIQGHIFPTIKRELLHGRVCLTF